MITIKQLRYECEDSAKVFRIALYLFIGLLIVTIIAGIYYQGTFFNSNIFTNAISMIVIGIIIYPILFLPFYLLILAGNKKNLQRIKELKQNGIKVDGIIIGWDYTAGFVADNGTKIDYYLIVEFINNQNTRICFKTLKVNFNPQKSLGSAHCTVYYDQSGAYATDFLKATNASERIFSNIPAESKRNQ